MAYSFCCAPLHAVRHLAQPPQGAERFRVVWPGWGESYSQIFIADSIRWLSTAGESSRWKRPAKWAERVRMPTPPRAPKGSATVSFGYSIRCWPARSGAGAGFDGAVGTIGVDEEWTGGTLDHFARDHDLFDAFQARQIEHGFEQDAFENRTQAARAGLALHRPSSDRAKSLIGERQLEVLHLEQPLILLHQRVLRIGQDLLERSFVEILQRGDHGQAARGARERGGPQPLRTRGA